MNCQLLGFRPKSVIVTDLEEEQADRKHNHNQNGKKLVAPDSVRFSKSVIVTNLEEKTVCRANVTKMEIKITKMEKNTFPKKVQLVPMEV